MCFIVGSLKNDFFFSSCQNFFLFYSYHSPGPSEIQALTRQDWTHRNKRVERTHKNLKGLTETFVRGWWKILSLLLLTATQTTRNDLPNQKKNRQTAHTFWTPKREKLREKERPNKSNEELSHDRRRNSTHKNWQHFFCQLTAKTPDINHTQKMW